MKKIFLLVLMISAYLFVDAQTKVIYTCPMHPQIKKDKPGTCPICGMTLVKKTVKVVPPKVVPKEPEKKPDQNEMKDMDMKKDSTMKMVMPINDEKMVMDSVESDVADQIQSKVHIVPGKKVRYDLYVKDTIVNFTGKSKRAIAINGSIPAPSLVFTEGVTVRERTETQKDGSKQFHQLDLGPIDHKIIVQDPTAGTLNMMVKGRVLGDITILNGADGGRIDFGTFSADLGASKSVTLLADRPGLDLTLVESETTPNYLKVRFEPLKEMIDGRKQWRLHVSVPKQMLYGSLAETSGVVLKTVGPNSRRLRFPVRGMTFDSGQPRL